MILIRPTLRRREKPQKCKIKDDAAELEDYSDVSDQENCENRRSIKIKIKMLKAAQSKNVGADHLSSKEDVPVKIPYLNNQRHFPIVSRSKQAVSKKTTHQVVKKLK